MTSQKINVNLKSLLQQNHNNCQKNGLENAEPALSENIIFLLNMYEAVSRQFSIIYLPTACYHYIFLDEEIRMNYANS